MRKTGHLKIQRALTTIPPKDTVNLLFDSLDISPSTRKDYAYRLPLFLHYLQSNPLHKSTYLRFKEYLSATTTLSLSSKAKYLIVAKLFLKALYQNNYIPIDITYGIKGFQQSKIHKKTGLLHKEIDNITSYINTLPNTPQSTRIKALFYLLTYQGLRQIEVTRINCEDINYRTKTILIQNKGNQDKEIVHLHPQTLQSLYEYQRTLPYSNGALFRSMGNRKSSRLTTRSLQRIFTDIFKTLSIHKSVHGFRHYFTTTLLNTFFGDVRTVKKFPRHKNLETLIIYDDELSLTHQLTNAFSAFPVYQGGVNARL